MAPYTVEKHPTKCCSLSRAKMQKQEYKSQANHRQRRLSSFTICTQLYVDFLCTYNSFLIQMCIQAEIHLLHQQVNNNHRGTQ